MAEAAGATTQDLLDRVGRKITVIGSIIAALVGMNTALTTCSNQSVTRYQSFHQAVDAEEVYWRSLYNDYLNAFRQGMSGEERGARLFALAVLAQRQVPDFHEYPLGLFGDDTSKRLAHDRLQTMKDRLRDALARPQSSDAAFAAQQQAQNFAESIGSVRSAQDRNAAPPDTAPDATPPPSSGVNYVTQILASGNPRGWDFDVFWCGGGDAAIESQNYAAGFAAARALADLSSTNQRLGDQPLGQVRLVMLPEGRQGGIYPVRGAGNQIRPERSPAEQQIADAVQRAIPGGMRYQRIPSDTASAWYLSLFACAAGTPPPTAPPISADTAAR
jgi:hypothetical protein